MVLDKSVSKPRFWYCERAVFFKAEAKSDTSDTSTTLGKDTL